MSKIILGNRYIIEGEIGAGGMAIVYKAHDNLLNRTVAVKVLRPEFKKDEEFIKRFDVEAKAAAGLNHPNIVAVYDVGEHEGLRYIVMEYIEGKTLKDEITQKGRIEWVRALRYARQICSALSHAHDKKIIHRDIKPHNIMVNENGMIKVMDFGIARATSSSTMTIGSKVLGSAHYLSPEQARGGFTDERSDLYSLGVCLYEMVVGKVPFDAETTVAVAMQHLQKNPTPVREIHPEIPESVEHIIMKALRKEQTSRYLSAVLMESDIIRTIADPSVVLSDNENENSFSTKQIDVIEEVPPVRKRPTKKKKDNKKLAILIAIILGIGALIGILISLIGGNEVKVPNLKGLTYEQAIEKVALIDSTIAVRVKKSEFSTPEEKNKIIDQEPVEGASVPGSNEIYVIVGRGEENFNIDNYVGMDIDDVKKAVEEAGLRLDIKEEDDDELNEKTQEDKVTRQEPEAGEEVKYGQKIVVYVSLGEEGLAPKVPSVTGLSEEDAKKVLNEAGFMQIAVKHEKSSEPIGRVIAQMPEAETRHEETAIVQITVSDGEDTAQRDRTVGFLVPRDFGSVRVKIIRKNTGETVYSKQHTGGENISVRVKANSNEKFEVYINDSFYSEVSVG